MFAKGSCIKLKICIHQGRYRPILEAISQPEMTVYSYHLFPYHENGYNIEIKMSEKPKIESKPGDGIRSLKTSKLFKTLNFELYMKPNAVIMGLGLLALSGSLMYITYMRHKYESLGYYSAIQEDGKEQFLKKKSRWE